MKASKLLHAVTIGNGLLKATALLLTNVSQESEDLQEIGLSGCIGPQQVSPLLQRNVDIAKVTPVLQL